MKNIFKKYFIPHEHNEYQPHLLRSKSVKYIASFIIILELIFLVQIYFVMPRSANFLALILPDVIVSETNDNRVADNLIPLKVNPLLQEAAREKANDMAEKGYFAHTSPEGKTPWYWFDRVGYSFVYAGENLAVNFSDSKDVINAWMDSPGHRANIMNQYFSEIGIGVAKGNYEGVEAEFVVQLFGRPVPAVAATAVRPKISPKPSPIAKASPLITPQTETFAAVKGVESDKIVNEVKDVNTAVNDNKSVQPYALEKIFSNPKVTVTYIYFILGAVVLAALMLTIFVKVRIQFPRLIMNGVFILIVITGVIIINQFLAGSSIQII